MMKKLIIASIIIALLVIIGYGIFNQEEKTSNEKESREMKDILITIDGKDYNFELENNETTKKLLELLPLKMDMEELNGNEYYYYMDSSLPAKDVNPGNIKTGDVYLYNDNCLVIFYKDFKTSYRYTKIGHIDDLILDEMDSIEVNIEE